jgi:hypothetical protein
VSAAGTAHGVTIPYGDQLNIFNPDTFTEDVHVIGLGGLGSAVAFSLVKLGLKKVKLHLWDRDRVEPHNVPCQLIYRPSDIDPVTGLGRPKVEAAVEFLSGFAMPELTIVPHREFITAETPLSGVIIGCVDNMDKGRIPLWEAIQRAVAEDALAIPLYIDTRMGGHQIQIFSINPTDVDDEEYYGHWLFPDAEASAEPCAERTNIAPPLMVAGRVITQFTRFSRELPLRRMIDEHVDAVQLYAHDKPKNEE